MADNCRLQGIIRTTADVDMGAVRVALRRELDRHCPGEFDDAALDDILGASIFDEEHIVKVDEGLSVQVQLRATAGFTCPEASAISAALDCFAERPSWLVLTDDEVSPSTDGAQTVYPVGRTPVDRERAQALYGLSRAREHWTHPALQAALPRFQRILEQLGPNEVDLPDVAGADALRAQAAALLERAQALDGLKPFVALHSQRNRGDSPYLVWASSNPGHRADEVLAEEFDPERDALTVLDLLGAGETLSCLTGVAPSTRVRGYGPAAQAQQPARPSREEMVESLRNRLADGVLSLEALTQMVVDAGLSAPGDFLAEQRERFDMEHDDESSGQDAPRSRG